MRPLLLPWPHGPLLGSDIAAGDDALGHRVSALHAVDPTVKNSELRDLGAGTGKFGIKTARCRLGQGAELSQSPLVVVGFDPELVRTLHRVGRHELIAEIIRRRSA